MMNNDFNIIKKSNFMFFDTIDIIARKNRFERDGMLKDLNNKIYRGIFFHSGIHQSLGGVEQIYIMDTNHKQWYFNINSDSYSFDRGAHFDNVIVLSLKEGVTLRHTEQSVFIHKSNKKEDIIIDLTGAVLNDSEVDKILLTKDINLKEFQEHTPETFVLPMANGRTFRDLYEAEEKRKNDNKGFFRFRK